MFRSLQFGSSLALLIFVGPLFGQDSWIGEQVMPRNESVKFTRGDGKLFGLNSNSWHVYRVVVDNKSRLLVRW